jgi:carboxylate-amine ligase
VGDELFTIGVEEEFLLVDPRSRGLRRDAEKVLAGARAKGLEDVEPEFRLAQLETATGICASLHEVRSELVRLRRQVVRAAEGSGCHVGACGTHPFSHWDEAGLTPKEAYLGLEDEYQQLAREKVVCGCHVHIGLSDAEAVVQVLDRVRPWLAPVVALSANSPFWVGRDTGYASFRTVIQHRAPLGGMPEVLGSRAAYDRFVDTLRVTGTIDDPARISWDVRPSSRYRTIEFRVADVCLTVDEAVMVAGLARALAATAHAEWRRDERVLRPRPELFRVASWRAARYGLEGELLDVVGERLLPAPAMLDRLLEHLRPGLEEHGDWDHVASLVHQVRATGTGAARQRAAFRRSGRLEDVMSFVVEETAKV